jgi:hypothetical protein
MKRVKLKEDNGMREANGRQTEYDNQKTTEGRQSEADAGQGWFKYRTQNVSQS